MKHPILLIIVALALLSLAACNVLSPEQQGAIGTVLGDMYREGKLTAQQYEALLQALQTGRYDQLIAIATEVGAAVVLSLFGVRVWRGPITQRKGVAPGVEIVPPAAPIGVDRGA